MSTAAKTIAAPWLWASVSSASQFVSIVGGAVSLLLVFRTNAAFARFCAAADSFADVLASTRNLSRKMAVWAPVTHRSSLAVRLHIFIRIPYGRCDD